MALRHKTPNRTPVDAWFRPEVEQAMRERLGCADQEELYQRLGIDFRYFSPALSRPEFRRRLREGGTSETSEYLPLGDRLREWVWGTTFRTGSDGKYEEWVDGPLTNTDNLSDFTISEEIEIIQQPEFRRSVESASEFFTAGVLNSPFKIAWHLRGFEKWLMDYYLNPEFAEELSDRLWATTLRVARFMAEGGVDCIALYGDVAMQDNMLISPDIWRKFEKPRLAKFIAAVRATHPGMFVLFHSDGDVTPIVGDLVEVGVDILNPIQPECMDPEQIKRDYGSRLTLHGTISVQTTLPDGPPEKVRAEVRRRIETCGSNGGLVIGPTNNVQFDTPSENIIALYEEVTGRRLL